MGSTESDEALERRIEKMVSGLDATLAAGATIRPAIEGPALALALPVLSIDTGGPRASAAPGAAGAPPADLELLGLLGSGGMGAVYAARQRALDREVAIKRPLAADSTPEARAALIGEARTMGALEHPNIVPVHALGTDRAGLPLLVMKRIEGVSWRDLMRDEAHPMWERLGAAKRRGMGFHLEVLMHVCNALHFAHSRGVVHRDVKPENVMIGAFGEIYLLDWGIAWKLGAGGGASIVGTPTYMAPEMLLDPPSADERTDVYLVGATLHELLVGAPIHSGTTLPEVFHSVLSAGPFEYPESIPADLAALARAATSRERTERPASCAAMRDALAAHVAHRASHELAVTAAAKLDEAEARVRASPEAASSVEVGVVLAEARFGFEQSLRQWPENDAARRGLCRCIARAVERELSQRNAVAARALLAALPEREPALEAAVAVLEAELQAARERESANAARARDLDASVSAWPRILALGVFLVLGGGLSVLAYIDEQVSGQPMSVAEQLGLDVGIGAILLAALAIGRRRLLSNTYYKNLWGLWVLGIVAVGLSDAYLGSLGVDPAHATAIDFGIVAVVFGAGALTFSRGLALVAGVGLISATISAFFPALSTPAATMALFLMIGIQIDPSRRSAARAAK